MRCSWPRVVPGVWYRSVANAPPQCMHAAQVSKWVMFDDTTITTVGGWEQVLAKCEKGRIQPCLLFYERPQDVY